MLCPLLKTLASASKSWPRNLRQRITITTEIVALIESLSVPSPSRPSNEDAAWCQLVPVPVDELRQVPGYRRLDPYFREYIWFLNNLVGASGFSAAFLKFPGDFSSHALYACCPWSREQTLLRLFFLSTARFTGSRTIHDFSNCEAA